VRAPLSFALVELRFSRHIFLQMEKIGNHPLRIVPDPASTGPQPSWSLDEHGMALWNRVVAEYDVSDCCGIEFLCQAAQAVDLAEALSARIAEDGEIIRKPNGLAAEGARK
jgi:hypothetical protein